MSASVLKLIDVPDKQFTISGPQWLDKGEERHISIASIPTNILCKRHNEALSGLDKIGQRFFEFLLQENSQNEYLMINGDEVERWMPKLLCGQISSGWSARELRYWQPPFEWLDILFASGTFPKEGGLYVFKGKDIKTHYHQVGAWLVGNEQQNGLFNGLYFLIAGFQFLFFIGSPKKESLDKILASGWQLHYRPECIVVVNGLKQREVHLGLPPRSGFLVMKVDSSQ